LVFIFNNLQFGFNIMNFLVTNFNKFYLCVFIVAFTTVISAKAAEVNVRINPGTVMLGEPAELRLSSQINFPSLIKLPKINGIKWQSTVPSQSSQISITNSRRTTIYTSIYYFTVNKTGYFRLPNMSVKLGSKTITLPSRAFRAQKHSISDSKGKQTTIDDLLYASATLDTDRDFIYLGEEVPLEIKLYSANGLNLTCSWPSIDADNIVMRDYSQVNPEAPSFMPPTRKSIVLDKQKFNVDMFKSAIRPISLKPFSGSVKIQCQVRIPRQRGRSGFFDSLGAGSFFGNGYKMIRHNVIATLPNKEIKPLPDFPENTKFLGLVGQWRMSIMFDSKALYTGDPLTLKIIISGNGSLDTLAPPDIKLPGFIAYPPEVEKRESPRGGIEKAEIRYALIPKEEGPVHINLAFCVFQTQSQKFLIKKFNKKFNVKKGEKSVAIVDDAAENKTIDEMQKQESLKNKSRHDILSLKNTDASEIDIPLLDNHFNLILFFIFFGPISLLIFEYVKRYKLKLQDNPILRRRKNAMKIKRNILKILNEAEPDQLHDLVQNKITPFLNDLYGFPPGTSSTELADLIKDKELAENIRSASASSYMPGVIHKDPVALKRKLLASLKKASILFLVFIPLFTYAQSDKFNLKSPEAAYASGKYKKAEILYRTMLKRKKTCPAILYNIGNCLYKQGELPEALVYYERARRLDPADSDIFENLNVVRRKLMLPEIGKVKNPLDSLVNIRDSFRPDQWLLFAAIFWSAFWLVLITKQFLTKAQISTALSLIVVAMLLCLIAYLAQKNSTYSQKFALVVKKAPVYTLPTTISEKSNFELTPGTDVQIEENRHNWKRIRNEESEGWVKGNVVQSLCPYK
jgi:tetratricopeptide (TPR) repeat protein